jgi:hypothetical protein
MYGYQQPPAPYGMQQGFQQPGFQQPGFQQPPMMQPPAYMHPGMSGPYGPNGPTIINIASNHQEGTKCPYCTEHSENLQRKSVGCVTWSWCICLTFTFPPLFFVPFCVDGCKDTEFVCVKCHQVKSTVRANCCWYSYDIKLTSKHSLWVTFWCHFPFRKKDIFSKNYRNYQLLQWSKKYKVRWALCEKEET